MIFLSENGWHVTVGQRGELVLFMAQFDPEDRVPSHGIKELHFTKTEARRMARAILDITEEMS